MCSKTPILSDKDTYHANALHILTSFEVPIHIFGAYIIIAKTPNNMKNVRTNMLVLHLAGALLDIYMSCLEIPVFLLPACAVYPLGVLTMLGVSTVFQAYVGVSLIGGMVYSGCVNRKPFFKN